MSVTNKDEGHDQRTFINTISEGVRGLGIAIQTKNKDFSPPFSPFIRDMMDMVRDNIRFGKSGYESIQDFIDIAENHKRLAYFPQPFMEYVDKKFTIESNGHDFGPDQIAQLTGVVVELQKEGLHKDKNLHCFENPNFMDAAVSRLVEYDKQAKSNLKTKIAAAIKVNPQSLANNRLDVQPVPKEENRGTGFDRNGFTPKEKGR